MILHNQLELSKGVIVPIITPFVHSDILSIIDHILDQKISMIFLLGTTGEALKISHREKLELIKNVACYTKNKKVQLLIGITSYRMNEAIELMQLSNEVGAFASVIAPIVINNNSISVIQQLLSASDGNLLLYNYPAISNGHFLEIKDITFLSSEPRILGIKDSSGDFTYLDQLLHIKNMNNNFKIYYGPEKNLVDALKKNIDGFVPASGNLEPGLAKTIWDQRENAPWSKWYALKDLIRETNDNYIIAIKKILKERGLIVDEKLISQNGDL